MTLQCVVVGVDGSEPSMRANAFAVQLLGGTEGRLVVASAYVNRPELPVSDNAQFRDEIARTATAAADLAASHGVECRVVVAEGDPESVLVRVVNDEGADLLVVGTRGRSGIARAILGSTAVFFTTHSTTPVAVVH